ncbi:hypothetical protein D9619_013605 [Psilocybe cf. subviscida]|uniref:Uncharacterized protein n=1 Tax=Psilocybe cf. subviscida TaxID=2480587 RepID=A0A8H5F8X6_9AGAR|nr:hypothetical protein D9619_013605 [Psilocybe cf. subviscida]
MDIIEDDTAVDVGPARSSSLLRLFPVLSPSSHPPSLFALLPALRFSIPLLYHLRRRYGCGQCKTADAQARDSHHTGNAFNLCSKYNHLRAVAAVISMNGRLIMDDDTDLNNHAGPERDRRTHTI